CGMDLSNVTFVWASDLVKDDAYWKIVMNVARENTVKRIVRCSQIMGRSESDALSAAQILYPCMQCADIFYLKADVTQLGMDQRKVNVLAREVAPKLGYPKPIIVSHHMLMGLAEPPKDVTDGVQRAVAMKMSKSNPDSAIFMTDTKEEVDRKIKKAYGPPKEVKENPLLEYCKYIIFEKKDAMVIKRPEKFGGDLTFSDYASLESAYEKGDLHPADLKPTIAGYLNELLQPVRDHFANDKGAKKILEQVESFSVTR
ncbi:MAG: tyrosine--tRNA ligase, partial [Nanoarchaeota archaeon]